jgi:hypothetical protein
MPPSPCPNDPTHPVEFDRTLIDRCWCSVCNLVYPFEPPPSGRQPYKDGD